MVDDNNNHLICSAADLTDSSSNPGVKYCVIGKVGGTDVTPPNCCLHKRSCNGGRCNTNKKIDTPANQDLECCSNEKWCA